MCSKQVRGDPYWALAHQTTQNGTLTTSGLLRCGNLVICRTQVRRDPYMTSLSSMMIWTLTPPRSRSFLNRVNDRLPKMLDRSPEDAMQDIDKRSMIWRMFMSSTLEASVFIGEGLLGYRGKSHFKADVRDI